MQDLFSSRLERSKEAVRNWWLLLLLGILVFAAGVLTFLYPGASYVTLALMFGILMLVAGVVNIAFGTVTDHVLAGRGWSIALGAIELILGFILVCNPAISAATLPFFLGFWLMFRSFSMIGAGSDMMILKIDGGGWMVLLAVLLLLCSVMILIDPIWFGTSAVLIWVGVSLLMGGLSISFFAFQLKGIHKHIQKVIGER